LKNGPVNPHRYERPRPHPPPSILRVDHCTKAPPHSSTPPLRYRPLTVQRTVPADLCGAPLRSDVLCGRFGGPSRTRTDYESGHKIWLVQAGVRCA